MFATLEKVTLSRQSHGRTECDVIWSDCSNSPRGCPLGCGGSCGSKGDTGLAQTAGQRAGQTSAHGIKEKAAYEGLLAPQ